MLNRKECARFMRWWRENSGRNWVYVYLDWNGDLVFRDIYHGQVIVRIFEKDGKCVLALRGKPFEHTELDHIKWLVEVSNARSRYQR